MKRILLLENSSDTVAAIRSQTEDAGLVAEWNNVTSRDEFKDVLTERNSDVIIVDFDLPDKTGDEALAMRNLIRPELPFLALSEKIDEQFIVNTMKSGATDFIFKGRLGRLGTRLKEIFSDEKNDGIEQVKGLSIDDLANAITDGLVICDALEPEMPILYCNEAFTNLTGYPRDQILGKKCRFLHNDDQNQEDIRQIHEAIENGIPGRAVIRNHDPDGKLYWMRMSVSPVRNDRQQITHFVGLVDDVSDYVRDRQILDRSLHEKEVLLKEIHHRVKNNLAILSGMMDLQAEYIDSPSTRKILKESKNRIKSIAIIHEKLYRSTSLSDIDFKDYLEDLLFSIKETFFNDIKHINIDFDTPSVIIGINQAIPTALILNELVTNAFEHAFPYQDEGKVTVRLTSDESILQLEVKDDGIGLPESLNLDTPKSLGLLLVKALTKQLGGTIRFDNDSGTLITLQYPLEKKS